MQNWSCMHLCGHSNIKFLGSCDTRAHDLFFSILVNPVFPKYVLLSICAFIRVHFGRPGKFSQHSPFRCIHIFSKTSYDQWIFSKKSWKSSLFKSMLVFQLDNSLFFSFSSLFFLTCSLFFLLALFFLLFFLFFYFIFIFIMIFVCFIFWTMFLNEELYMVQEFQINIIDNNDISINATIQTKMYALYKRQSKQ